MFFHRVPEQKVVKNRVHLDVRVGLGLRGAKRLEALETKAARLEQHGAKRLYLLEADGLSGSFLVIQGIEGNEFCLD